MSDSGRVAVAGRLPIARVLIVCALSPGLITLA